MKAVKRMLQDFSIIGKERKSLTIKNGLGHLSSCTTILTVLTR